MFRLPVWAFHVKSLPPVAPKHQRVKLLLPSVTSSQPVGSKSSDGMQHASLHALASSAFAAHVIALNFQTFRL